MEWTFSLFEDPHITALVSLAMEMRRFLRAFTASIQHHHAGVAYCRCGRY